MNKTTMSLAFIACLGTTQSQALTVYYQPTPYPQNMADGKAMPQDLDKIHIIDGWLASGYPVASTFVRDGQLKMGGWGDYYIFGINFDFTGLPIDPNFVALWLNSYQIPGGSTPMQYQLCIPNSKWDVNTTWNTRPSLLGCTGPFAVPTNGWNGWGITAFYQNWRNGIWGSHGIFFQPMATQNNSVQFRSSRYADFAADPTADGKRPILQFDITPSIELKMPLPAGYSWLVTTEPGGYDCKGAAPWPDVAHQGTKYFSIDFSTKNRGGVVGVYGSSNTPALTAAYGVVYQVGYDNMNGNYIFVDHDGDRNPSTGFQTKYLHFKSPAARKNGTLLKVGDVIQQGDQLGIIGTTGLSFGVHLHFGVFYKNDASPTIPELTKVVMDGRLLRSYQTECTVNSGGVPLSPNRYYFSTNTPTGL